MHIGSAKQWFPILKLPEMFCLPLLDVKAQVLVGNKVYSLKRFIMQPYSRQKLDNQKRIFNYCHVHDVNVVNDLESLVQISVYKVISNVLENQTPKIVYEVLEASF